MIRQAVASDAVKAVPLIAQAIGHITFVLTGTTESQEAASILSDFFGQEANRISYQNALAMEEEGELVGVAIFYDGAKARELDAPLERAAAKKSGDSSYSIPTEPEASEFYLDTLCVSPRCQGKGYGRQLIEAGCDRARKLGHHRISLLVEVDRSIPSISPTHLNLQGISLFSKKLGSVGGVVDTSRTDRTVTL
jgi:GNAT superfamily N-acetyltransferase